MVHRFGEAGFDALVTFGTDTAGNAFVHIDESGIFFDGDCKRTLLSGHVLDFGKCEYLNV